MALTIHYSPQVLSSLRVIPTLVSLMVSVKFIKLIVIRILAGSWLGEVEELEVIKLASRDAWYSVNFHGNCLVTRSM